MIVASTGAAATALFVAQCYAAELFETRRKHNREGYFKSLEQLVMFLLETAGNIVVQLTSSLAAALAISVFSSADSLVWGFAGALISLTLLWILRKTIITSG